MKKNILIIIMIFFIAILCGYIAYDNLVLEKDNNVVDKGNDDINSDNNLNSDITNNETEVDDGMDMIRNLEVRELYNYVKADLVCNDVCKGYYYQNPFKNHTLEDKVGLLLMTYGDNYYKEIDDAILNKMSKQYRESKFIEDEKYIEADVVRNALKSIFNIDVKNFKDDGNYCCRTYNRDADVFITMGCGGGYFADIEQKIIEYNELEDEINLTVVKAEVDFDNNVYRYVNNSNTLVYKNASDNFKFTTENIDKFPQIKYIFRKNNEGKYYVSDIINLNYEEDFASCD